MIPFFGYYIPHILISQEEQMITGKSMQIARAECFCNGSEFKGLGEGKNLSIR